MPELTDDDVAKRVLSGSGEEIGVVDDVEDGTAYIAPNREMASQLKSKLGWSADNKATYPLRNDAVSEVTDEAIRLRDEYAGDAVN